jgi:outer membrane protein TolC
MRLRAFASLLVAVLAAIRPCFAAPPAAAAGATGASPGGLTARDVARRAAALSYSATAASARVREAAAAVDRAWASFLPRLTATARYTRLSPYTPPPLSLPGFNAVVTTEPSGTPNPVQTTSQSIDLTSAPVLDQYWLQASVTVPLSDWFTTLPDRYSASSHDLEAAVHDAAALRSRAALEGEVAFYTWLQARGTLVVALQALDEQKRYLQDTKNLMAAGTVTRADVLRAETGVTSANIQVEHARGFVDVTEEEVRAALHLPDDAGIAPGEALDSPLSPVVGTLSDYSREALSRREELKSFHCSAEAARLQASASRAGAFPILSGVGEADYANPNPRLFPATPTWYPTWSVGVQLSWSPTDVPGVLSSARGSQERAAELEADEHRTQTAIQLEVARAWSEVREADAAHQGSVDAVASATEACRVARDLYLNNLLPSATVTDAEGELVKARLSLVATSAEARIARARLGYAVGRAYALL